MNYLVTTFAAFGLAWWIFYTLEESKNRKKYEEQKTKTNKRLNMSKAQYRAFIEGYLNGSRSLSREKVYEAIVEGPKNVRGVMVYLANRGKHMKESTATGRISELQDMGAIYEAAEGVYQVCRTEQEQEDQRQRRFSARKKRWVNEGKRYGWLWT